MPTKEAAAAHIAEMKELRVRNARAWDYIERAQASRERVLKGTVIPFLLLAMVICGLK